MNDLSKVCKSVSIYPNINEKIWPENDLCLILEDIVLTNEEFRANQEPTRTKNNYGKQ